MKWVVGLGNPGRKYEWTRHNIGFMVVEELARRFDWSFHRSWRFPAHVAKGTLGGETVHLVKPLIFMNRSGLAVKPILRKGGGTTADLIVVFDDTALEWGRLRVRAQGSAGGHHGVQSIIHAFDDGAFSRIRVGIGLKPDMVSLPDYVLAPFSAAERREMECVIRRATDAIEMVCTAGVERAMNCFNGGQEQGEKN